MADRVYRAFVDFGRACQAVAATVEVFTRECRNAALSPPEALRRLLPEDCEGHERTTPETVAAVADNLLMTYHEVAGSLRVSSKTVMRLIKDGDLPAVTVRGEGGAKPFRRIRRSDLETFVESLS